jgi:hypothetical protein
MKKAYEDMAQFVRWVLAAVAATIVALPVIASLGAAN